MKKLVLLITVLFIMLLPIASIAHPLTDPGSGGGTPGDGEQCTWPYDEVWIGDSRVGGLPESMVPAGTCKWWAAGMGGYDAWSMVQYAHQIGIQTIHLAFGMGDIVVGNNLFDTALYMNNYVQYLRTRGHDVDVVEVVYCRDDWAYLNGSVTILNNWYRNIANNQGVPYIELNSGLAPNGVLKAIYSADGLHFSSAAYPIWLFFFGY